MHRNRLILFACLVALMIPSSVACGGPAPAAVPSSSPAAASAIPSPTVSASVVPATSPAPSPSPAAKYEVVSLELVPAEAKTGEEVKVTAVVRNSGNADGNYSRVLKVDGVEVGSRTALIRPGSSDNLTFSLTCEKAGSYRVQFDTLERTLTVKTPVSATTRIDPAGDMFDAKGSPVAGEAFVDILESEVTQTGNLFVFRIKTGGQLPEKLADPNLYYEWGVFMNAASNYLVATVTSPLMTNDLASNVFLRVILNGSGYSANILELQQNRTVMTMDFKVSGDTITFSQPSDGYIVPPSFSWVSVARRYGQKGAPASLQFIDKAPNEGHYTYPNK